MLWSASVFLILKKIFEEIMVNSNFSSYTPVSNNVFSVGDQVEICQSAPPGHRRTPAYIRGKRGVIERICGSFRNPEELAYGFDGLPMKVLYRVAFKQVDVWLEYSGSDEDTIELEIYEHWLKRSI